MTLCDVDLCDVDAGPHNSICCTRLIAGSKAGFYNMVSSCKYGSQLPLNHRTALKSSKKSPCSNWPLRCPQCVESVDVWKYSMAEHLRKAHPGFSESDDGISWFAQDATRGVTAEERERLKGLCL